MIPDDVRAQLNDNEIQFLEEAIRQRRNQIGSISTPAAIVTALHPLISRTEAERILVRLEHLGLVQRTGRAVMEGSEFRLWPGLL